MATPSGIDDAIAGFEARVRRLGLASQHLDGAREPITDAELEAVAERISPLELPDSIAAVARWHHGGFRLDFEQWLSFGEAFALRDQMRVSMAALAERFGDRPFPVPDQWLPIMRWEGIVYFVELLPEPRTESKTWHFAASGGPAVTANYSSVEMMFRVATAKLGKPDEYQSTELDFALDPGYARHEYIECLVEELPEVWPARWDLYPLGPAT
ncbi:MAG: hypothetical protein GY698_18570 [Actinomycetia bacterium]|nr:hypothetical protein [Actinomycetes bacterium]